MLYAGEQATFGISGIWDSASNRKSSAGRAGVAVAPRVLANYWDLCSSRASLESSIELRELLETPWRGLGGVLEGPWKGLGDVSETSLDRIEDRTLNLSVRDHDQNHDTGAGADAGTGTGTGIWH